MRKGYLIIAAVATSFLASCSNERVLNELQDDDAIIRFESYSEKETKVPNTEDLSLEFYHNTFSVYSTKKDMEDKIDYVFGDTAQSSGITCTYTDNPGSFHGSNWRYLDERYWDKSATYKIIACAPSNETISPIRYIFSNTHEVDTIGKNGSDFIIDNYYLTGKNLQQAMPQATLIQTGFNVQGEDLDMMTSKIRQCLGSEQYNYPVQFEFHHILSKLNVSVRKLKDANGITVVIDSIIITGLKDMGSYKESLWKNTTNPFTGIVNKHSGWTLAETNHAPNYAIKYNGEANHPLLPDAEQDPNNEDEYITKPIYYIESLVMPQELTDNAKIKLKYHIVSKLPGGRDESFTYIKSIKEIFNNDPVFFDRFMYTIDVKLDIKAVIFDVSTDNWIERSAGVTVNPLDN